MKDAVLVSILAISILTLVGIALAAPLPLQIIVNNDSMQCARFLPGDECMDCTPPEGWQVLRSYASCPESYKLVTVRGNCTGFEVEHCCTEKHSGASGYCRNLIKNDITKECTFVRNASNYTLPAGWTKMSVDDSPGKWVCPLAYAWTTLTANNPSAITQFGPVNVVSAIDEADFQVLSGNYVSGWTWLTQPGQSATWAFYNLPTDRKL
jgi:hypothetical protein